MWLMFKFWFWRFTALVKGVESMNFEAIDVVVGIVLDGDSFLVERRRLDDKVDPSVVCLPGGHVRVCEGLGKALEGEMLEELGIRVKGFRFVCRNFYVASNCERQNAYCFLVTDYEGAPFSRAAEEIFWEDDVDKLSLEVDRKTIRKTKSFFVLKAR